MQKKQISSESILNKINTRTKPLGALGLLEETALKICTIQNSLSPSLNKPAIVVYAADHGAAKNSGISAYPQEVTYQMVLNYLAGGAAINVFSRMNSIDVRIIDAGVNYKFNGIKGLIDLSMGSGTKDYTKQPAMSVDDCIAAILKARNFIKDLNESGCNIVGCGEMGIGNTASASMLISVFLGLPIKECTGKGTGLDDLGVKRKGDILHKVLELHHPDKNDPVGTLSKIGGFEIAMMTGTFLEARERGMIIMIDGFIASAALLVACAMNRSVLDNCIFCHQSDESGHRKILDFFNAKPLLSLNMRVGEATGCAVAYPIIKASVAFLNEMATFQSAGVSEK